MEENGERGKTTNKKKIQKVKTTPSMFPCGGKWRERKDNNFNLAKKNEGRGKTTIQIFTHEEKRQFQFSHMKKNGRIETAQF